MLPLRLGSRGEDVRRVQGILGEVQDGIFGEVTRAAVRAWQQARGLAADGVVGPATWAAMQKGGVEATLDTDNQSTRLPTAEVPRSREPELPEAAIALVKRWESFRAKPYLCLAGVPTIGYGATYYLTGRKVTLQDPAITEQEASVLLRKMLDDFSGQVRGIVKVPLTDNEFGALTSFAYNVGAGALKGSTLLRKLNDGDIEGAAAEFGKWVKSGGTTLPGLVSRRAEEAALFGTP